MAFWIVFSVIHILATLLLSTQLYYMGRWRLGKIGLKRSTQQMCSSSSSSKCDDALFSASVSDSGVLRRIGNVIYTDCIRQCSGPMYIVSPDC